MKIETKAFIIKTLIFIVIFLIIQFTLIHFLKEINGAYIAGITGFITAIISPQMKVIDTQSGNKIQIKWIFSKKTKLIQIKEENITKQKKGKPI